MSSISVFAIRVYQKTFSPLLYRWGVRCRFYPSCSAYAVLAFQQDGFREGFRKTYHRLLRCRPDNLESCIDFLDSIRPHSVSQNQKRFMSSSSVS
jgi:putative membrane protein insertion efficiency factor